jgi:hypothetical protein
MNNVTVNSNRHTQLLVTANVVPSLPILVTLMMEALTSFETSALKEPHGVTSQMTAFLKGAVVLRGEGFALHSVDLYIFREVM